jgi:ApbE superfamily uncharacterized protein (UPF0280 family)
MIRHHFQLKETIATILADDQAAVRAACTGMVSARQAVEHQIAIDPFFRTTLEPYTPDSEDETILRMTAAAKAAGVGPMAAVAGAIAWAGAESMTETGVSFGVIDNGGDIALFSDRSVTIGVHAGDAPVSNHCAFVIPPQGRILGCCTSSATVGPSISFGIADAVTVFSRDVACADAWATAICNEVRPGDMRILSRPDPGSICGVFIVIGTVTASFGKLPPLQPVRVDPGLITAGKPVL